jgi:hypothetical protein
MLGRARHEGRSDDEAPSPQEAGVAPAEPAAATADGNAAEDSQRTDADRTDAEPTDAERTDAGRSDAHARPPDAVNKDQLEQLTTQVRELQHQVEQLTTRRSEVLAIQAGERVAAIVQAAEESAAGIAAHAHEEGAALREQLRAEAQAEADRIRGEAQADATRIRAEAYADASRTREQLLIQLRTEVEHACARLAEDLSAAARGAIDAIAGGAPVSDFQQAEPQAEAAPEEAPESPVPDVEEAVDEFQSAASMLEQSLRHLHDIGRNLPEAQ